MINSLPFLNTVSPALQLVVFLGLNLAIGLYFLRRKRALGKVADLPEPGGTSSPSSAGDRRVSRPQQEEVSALVEAEIYVINGQNYYAQKVLDAALREGLITTGQVIRFWSERRVSRAG